MYFSLHRRVYSTVYSVLSECLWKKNITGDLGGIRTHDLLLTRADVLTSRPPSLPDDDARILCSCGFRVIYMLMKLLRQVINNWFNNFALHRRVYKSCLRACNLRVALATCDSFMLGWVTYYPTLTCSPTGGIILSYIDIFHQQDTWE